MNKERDVGSVCRRLWVGALLIVLSAAASARAAEPLVWKFKAGDKLRYRLKQTIAFTIDLGAGGKQAQEGSNLFDIAWTVADVKRDGSATIKQRYDRIVVGVKPASGGGFEYSSDSTDEPQGFAAMVAPLIKEMSRAEITFTMSPRGKISDVKLPEALAALLVASPGTQALGSMGTEAGFKDLVARTTFELPEKLEPNTEWTTESTGENSDLGKQTIRSTFRYLGPKKVDGVEYEAFSRKSEIEFAGGTSTVSITKQDPAGEALFNRAAGRLQSSRSDGVVDVTITTNGKPIAQTMKQSTSLEWIKEKDKK